MKKRKTSLEIELEKYYYSMRMLKQLTTELAMAKEKYDNKLNGLMPGFDYASIRSKGRKNSSPTERAAILLADNYSKELDRISERLNAERRIIARIQEMVDKADLTGQEREYIRLRYFEMNKLVKIEQKMYCSHSTLKRLKKSALEKLEVVYKLYYQRAG